MPEMGTALETLIKKWRDDPGATYRSWFLWEERLKNFRSIRRGILQVIEEIENGTFGVAYRGSSLETVLDSIAEQRQIARGAVRIDATSDDPLVQVTAFRDEGQGRVVLVAINNATSARTVDVSLQGMPTLLGTFTGERSTASAAWSSFSGATTATGWLIELPPQSVTSIAARASIGPDVAGDAGAGNGGARMGGCCETTGSDGRGGTALAVFVAIILRRRRVAVV
jgi:MYXO-CTERM domain-containing protein